MADANRALGFARGLRDQAETNRVRKIHDEERADSKSELEHARSRRTVVEARQDDAYKEGVTDRAQARTDAGTARSRDTITWDQKQKEIRDAMEAEGIRDLAEGLESGADPVLVAQQFNAKGQWKINPESIRYDKKTKKLSFAGAGGAQFDGTSDQLRAVFGAKKEVKKPIVVNKDARLATEEGKVLLDVDQSVKDAAKKEKSNISQFNPLTAAKDAQGIVAEYYKGTFDPELGVFSFDPGNRDKAIYGMGITGQLSKVFNSEGLRIMPQEIGQFAADLSARIPTIEEAKAQAEREVGPKAAPEAIAAKQQAIIRQARVKAGQDIDAWVATMEAAMAEQEAADKAAPGGKSKSGVKDKANRPPLSSFQKSK